ncbi:MAG TPA: flavin reductase family protein [Gaiellaceae bacterium]|nr:flavin reductase family protein [Gaiellaceae bacterium]
MTATAQRLAASEQAAANRLPQRERPMPPAFKLITDSTRKSMLIPDFVDAMSTLASGVVLVTVWVADRPWGMTVTAFASVSADPPTVLVSLGSETTSAREITATRSFGVSILAAEQFAVARLGSEPGAAKFLEPFVDRGDGSSDSPVVVGALAHLDCELSDVVPIADHAILFGRVRAARASCSGRPLLYHRRGYRTLGDRGAGCPPTETELKCLSS